MTDTSAAISNYDNREIAQDLKILFTQCFESVFVADGNGGYKIANTNTVQGVIWHFTENQYVWGEQKTLVERIKNYTGPSIPDRGFTRTLENGDIVTFFFQVIQPDQNDVQDFFVYKLEVTREPPHEHEFDSDWESDDTQHWKKCECGEKGDFGRHVGGTPDCKTPAVCVVCQQVYGGTDPDNHTGNTDLREQKEPKKEEPGYTGDTYCTDCNTLLNRGEEIPVLPDDTESTTRPTDTESTTWPTDTESTTPTTDAESTTLSTDTESTTLSTDAESTTLSTDTESTTRPADAESTTPPADTEDTSPNTGDTFDVSVCMLACLLSVLGGIVSVAVRKKTNEN